MYRYRTPVVDTWRSREMLTAGKTSGKNDLMVLKEAVSIRLAGRMDSRHFASSLYLRWRHSFKLDCCYVRPCRIASSSHGHFLSTLLYQLPVCSCICWLGPHDKWSLPLNSVINVRFYKLNRKFRWYIIFLVIYISPSIIINKSE